MPLKNVPGQTCAFVAKHLGLRHRYVYTKNNKLRLRYVMMMTATCAAVIPTTVAFSKEGAFMTSVEMASTAQMLNDVETSSGHSNAPAMAQSHAVPPQTDIASLALSESVPQFEEPLVPTDRVVTIGNGDALGKIMQKEGVGGSDVHEIITAMKEHFDPRDLKVGQDVHMHFQPSDVEGGYQLTGMKIELNPMKTVSVSKVGDSYQADMVEKEVRRVVQAQKAVIRNSLYGSAARAGIPKSVVSDTIKVFSQNVDFQRDVKSGDTLEVMYEMDETEDGYVAKMGDVLFAQLTVGGRKMPLYRYKMADGTVDYFGPDGQSTKKTLMKTPIDGARMSSGFGMRRHPILGYSKMHKGVDFAAPTGTPIYAAGDGKVEKAGRFSAYGNYVRIGHRNDLDTAYGHMSRIAPGIKPGVRVKQGQLIGYVGSTGRSTGPHLHYEVLVNNKQVNPRGINLPVGQALAGNDLKKFKSFVKDVNNQYALRMNGIVKTAQRQVEKTEDAN